MFMYREKALQAELEYMSGRERDIMMVDIRVSALGLPPGCRPHLIG